MSKSDLGDFYNAIRDVPDFPEQGIVFKDITPLLLRSDLVQRAVDEMARPFGDVRVDKVLAIESRGFIFGAPIASKLGAGLVLARKAGKLPWKRLRVDYALEYGTDAIEIHVDAIDEGERVLIVDDVLATGGTARAAADVAREAGGEIAGLAFLMELGFLNGRQKLNGQRVHSLLEY